MRLTKPIHTTLSFSDYNKIKEYEKGKLKDGIENLIKIAESKVIIVKIENEIEISGS